MKMISGYLGPDLKVEGDVESKESIRIDGEYRGNINSQREVTIGPSGDVKGKIQAPIIRVSGSVKGSIHASRLLELLGEAKVEGDLITPPGGLSMESGGSFEGQFVTNAALVSKDNESLSE